MIELPTNLNISDPASEVMFTPSEILEHLFCPRFTYFMHCLKIPQREEKRYKVLKGRELHKKRLHHNPDYKRKRLDCIKRQQNVYLASAKLHLRGIVDEILLLEDGSLAPLDYKMARPREKPFKTHRLQLVLYALIITETYKRPVKKGFLVYTVGGQHVSTIDFSARDFRRALKTVQEVYEIVVSGFLPSRTRYPARCPDCCYRNVCV